MGSVCVVRIEKVMQIYLNRILNPFSMFQYEFVFFQRFAVRPYLHSFYLYYM